MRIYIFKSETRKELRAFAGDPGGSKLPSQHGPWTVTGVVGPGRDPPYNLTRCDPKSNRCRAVSVVASRQEGESPQSERPNCIFDVARMMVRFARGPDDCATHGARLQGPAGRWLADLNTVAGRGDDQAKSLFNSSLRASLPARLAVAVVSK
jgi:hypothetical protein